MGVDLQRLRPNYAHLDSPGFHTGLEHEVVGKTPLYTVVHQIYAAVHLGSGDAGVGRNVRAPRGRVVTDEVVRLAGERVESSHLGMGIGANEIETHGRLHYVARRVPTRQVERLLVRLAARRGQ